MKKIYFILLISLTLFSACKSSKNISQQNYSLQTKKIALGIDVLQDIDFEFLKGKRVGLVTNPTGVNGNLKSTVDILFEHENVNLVALFGPEHGARGNFSAGDAVANNVDQQTGVPVFSLYGKNKKPNKEAMDMVDVIVYDIQDIGVRSYTYISTMGLVMEAAAEYGKQVVVLDRPNPLGGNRVEGPVVKDGFYSFVSQYKIPYVYGLTCGELAMLLNEEGLLQKSKKCNLRVVKMNGWKRDMMFNQTGLTWVPTSPHIPTWETAFYYASTGIIGELDPNLIGIGYTLPFQTLVTENIPAAQLATLLNQLNLEGVYFRPIYFKPYYKDKKDIALQGVQIHITDFEKVNLTELQFRFIEIASVLDSSFSIFAEKEDRYRMFDLGCGTDMVREKLMQTPSYNTIKEYWDADIQQFKEKSKNYYLYE